MFDSRASSGSHVSAARRGHGLDLGVCIRELDLHDGSFLDAIALHVDRLENTFRQILLDRSEKLGHEKREQDRQLLPLGARVRQNR
jgi:hypothetical protein